MIIKSVAVSGTVGKQVIARTAHILLKGFVLTPSGANATVTIRDGIGGVSGEVVFFGRAVSAGGSLPVSLTEGGMRFDKGLHVTVIGANAVCYLFVD